MLKSFIFLEHGRRHQVRSSVPFVRADGLPASLGSLSQGQFS